MKNKWVVEISQNGWEYTGFVTITADVVTKTGEKSLLADGVDMEFDEEIGQIEMISNALANAPASTGD